MNAPAILPPEETEETKLQAFLDSIAHMSVDKKVKLFVKTRDAKAAASKAFDAEDAKLKAIMEACQNHLLADADKAGVEGFKTEFGTTYTGEEKKFSIADDSAFEAFLDGQDDKYGFWERRPSSRRIEEFMKAHDGQLPPGLNLFKSRVMRVRKASNK